MNLKMDLGFDPKKVFPVLRGLEPYLFGLVLIGVFGYTAYVVNTAMNVTAAATPLASPAAKGAKITFDKATIESIKKLQVVNGEIAPVDLGKHDPFK